MVNKYPTSKRNANKITSKCVQNCQFVDFRDQQQFNTPRKNINYIQILRNHNAHMYIHTYEWEENNKEYIV